MKILFISPRFHTNQVGLIKILLKKGHNVKYLVNNFGPTEDHSVLKPIILKENYFSFFYRKFFQKESINIKSYFPNIKLFCLVLKQFKPDLVIFRKHGIIYFYLAAITCRIFKIKFVISEQVSPEELYKYHNGSVMSFLRMTKFNLKLQIFKAKWITPIPPLYNSSIKLPKNCFVIPFNVSINPSKKEYNTFNILFVAKFQNRKNHELLIRAVNLLKNDFTFKVLFVGEAVTKDQINLKINLEKEVAKMNLDHIIKFKENIDFNLMNHIYNNSNLFVFPSTNEPASISIVEAMANGLPVVCSDSCGNRSYIRDGFEGLYFKDNNLNSLYTQLHYLLNRKDICMQMSKSTIERTKKLVSEDYVYKCFLKLF